MRQWLSELPGWQKKSIAIIYDALMMTYALWFAFSLRLGEFTPLLGKWGILMLFAPLTAFPVFFYIGLYRLVMRHINHQMLWLTAKSVTLAVLCWSVVALIFRIPEFPRSVIFIYWLAAYVLIAAGRLIMRFWMLRSSGIPVVIYGSSTESVQLVTALQHGTICYPVALIDEDSTHYGDEVSGLRVYPPQDFSMLKKRYNIQEILLPTLFKTRDERNRVIRLFENDSVRVRTLPLLTEITQGKINYSNFEQVKAEDLLGRDLVPPKEELLTANIQAKAVMVTGAGGSIGSELCHQAIALKPSRLVILEQSEHALYQLEQSIDTVKSKLAEDIEIIYVLGSVQDQQLVRQILKDWEIETIYHAAAYKHVPIVEKNIIQGVRNNTFGTLVMAEAALAAKVKTFVLISTDKAVRPSSIMGRSKRLAEMILQSIVKSNDVICFSMVRFGNVIDSSGSVVPKFRQQIEKGGPLTITHQEMTRYFMTLNEAVELVIQAGSMGSGGDVFVLDMGELVKINDLAKTMIHLSGYRVKDENCPHGDIEIQYIGIRPGEKLYEELLIGDNITETQHPKIMRSKENFIPWQQLQIALQQLNIALESGDINSVSSELKELVDN